jgi:DNA invertase Pin-like site-specific DNA recombinase
MSKFFLYARKSTDEPDRQILSIEAQIAELREFAEREHLEIVQEFVESQTAKEPGRPIFNQMLSLIEKGFAQGILAWHPDRLARNSVDGGRIIYLIDTAKIRELKFPTFWFDATPQGKFMLNIAFGQSKYYIDNLSENVKRGLRQKVRRGEYPGVAPTGYLNDKVNHKMVKDPERYLTNLETN